MTDLLSPDHDMVETGSGPFSFESNPAHDQSEAYFEVYRVAETQVTSTRWIGGEWRWRLCSPSGAINALSAAYKTSDQCIEAVAALRRYSASADICRLTQ